MADSKQKNSANELAAANECARETIKQMATQRIAPTPENYQRIYNQIARIPTVNTLEGALAQALKQLPRETPEQSKWASNWEKLIADANWAELPTLINIAAESKVAQSKEWPTAIRDLIRTWDAKQAGLTTQRKKDALERVLNNFGSDPLLSQKLQVMTRSWSEYGSSGGSLVDEPVPADATNPEAGAIDQALSEPESNATKTATAVGEASFLALQDMLRQSIKYGLLPRLNGYPELQLEVDKIYVLMEKARNDEEWQTLSKKLRALFVRVEVVGAEQAEMQHGLLLLLKLLIDNITELVADDQWIRGQMALVQTVISSPLEKALIKDAEKSLREVIFKQGTLKHSLNEAKQTFKLMIATFIERLSLMSDSTSSYHDKVENYADQLSRMDDIVQINALLENLMHDTHVMQGDILQSREAMTYQRDQALSAEQKIIQLEEELSSLSEKVRVDQLTGILNRRGLDEAFVTELARAQREESALSIAMLDIDNFKRLNDTYGHNVGDAALQHLASLIKETIRPTDVVARFGGEEFVVLLPNTLLDEATTIIARLQRDLTKKFFLHNNERMLITFSAGIALLQVDESQESVLQRADQAMYVAKHSGKNRVITQNQLPAPVKKLQ